MSDLIELVVDHFTKINEHVLLELDFSVLVDLDATSVNDTHITDEVSSIFADDHELTFPELFVVGDLVVVTFTLSYLEDSRVTFERELEVLELFSVDGLKSHVKLMLGSFVSNAVKLLTFEARVDGELILVQLTHFNAAEVGVIMEILKSGIRVGSNLEIVNQEVVGVERIRVELDLVSNGVIPHGSTSISHLLYVDSNLLSIILESYDEV